MAKIAIISDTHGLLRPEAVTLIESCDTVIHAGDIGSQEILQKLRSLAPMIAVRGNMDFGAWTEGLPNRDVCEIGHHFFYLLHDLQDLDLDPMGEFDVVIFGHSHYPEQFKKDGVLYFNPGSAGPRRHQRPITMGTITLNKDHLTSEIITLSP